jgi:hypothetical protein
VSCPETLRQRAERFGPWFLGLVALLPLAAYRDDFRTLFWFGDDWDQLDQIARLGFWTWTGRVFAENFVPLFKLAWGGLVVAGHGGYFAMILALWLTHAVNVALLGRLLRQEGFGWTSTSLTLAGFGLASVNIETLGWSIQWSAVLSTTFFLLAALWHGRSADAGQRDLRWFGVLSALVAASALTFSRGVLTGFSLALASLLLARGSRLKGVVCCAVPALAVALVIYLCASGNQHDFVHGHKLGAMSQFALWYFSLNPLHWLLDMDSWGPRTTILLGLAKAALIVWALLQASARQRRLLGLFLVFEIGNSVLLGIGRYHTGLEATISPRYHYDALLCTLPFAGLAVEAFLRRRFARLPGARRAVACALVVAAALWVSRDWGRTARDFCDSRGRATRDLIFRQPRPPAEGAIPGIPFLPTARAKELVEIFHLH